MKTRSVIGWVMVLALGGASLGAQENGFVGRWKINLGKSSAQEIYPETLPETTLVIALDGANLTLQKTVSTSRGESTSRLSPTTDGKESVSAGQGFKDLKSSCRFEAGRLLINSEKEGAIGRMAAGGGAPEMEYFRYGIEEDYSLSEGNKTLTVVQKLLVPDGTKTITLVFDRI